MPSGSSEPKIRRHPIQRAEEVVLRALKRCAHARRLKSSNPSQSQRPRFRAVFISDVHLGLRFSQVNHLCRFLDASSSARLYLVGDIVDFMAIERSRSAGPCTVRLLRLFHRLARRGTEILLIPGNHDASLREHVGSDPAIRLHHDVIHRDARGRRLLVTHGDQADNAVPSDPRIVQAGTLLYDVILELSVALSRIRRALGLPYWNMAGATKRLVKQASTYIGRWEETVAREVSDRGLDGVICGHIHLPRIGEIGGKAYYNCGDWVEHGTAVAETWEGEFILLSAHDAAPAPSRARTTRLSRFGLPKDRGISPSPA